MKKVHERLYVGSLADLENFLFLENMEDFYILHCCKNPTHKEFVGYEGKSCAKDHPEYLVARRGNQMALNMVDAPKPEFFSKEMITAGLDFMEEGYNKGLKVLVVCNKGESRSPSIALLFMAARLKVLKGSFTECVQEFIDVYFRDFIITGVGAGTETLYMPNKGIYLHLMDNWDWYMNEK